MSVQTFLSRTGYRAFDPSVELAKVTGDVTFSGLVSTIKTSVNLAGNPTTTTQPPLTSDTTIATTEYVDDAVAAGGGGGSSQYNKDTLDVSDTFSVPVEFQYVVMENFVCLGDLVLNGSLYVITGL